jgi:hypothetical protein
MKFFNHAGQEIRTSDDWMRLAGPVSADHIADGRSAVEMRRAWMDGDAVQRVTELLAGPGGHPGVALERGIVEKLTPFDDNPRGPRHHDLLVIASAPTGPIVIGVEGKADETFGAALGHHVARARKGSSASGTPQRVDQLTSAFLGTTLAEDPSLATIPYQLLSALAGTMVDARKQDAVEAVVLVHEFRTTKTADRRHAANAAALDAFVARMHPTAARTGDETAWITDPFTVTWHSDTRPVRLAKLVTDARAPA